jgi:hypothetical protein
LGICIAPILQPFLAVLGADSKVCWWHVTRVTQQTGNHNGAYVLLPLAVNSKSERKVNSLPQLGLEPATFSMLQHLSDCSGKLP